MKNAPQIRIEAVDSGAIAQVQEALRSDRETVDRLSRRAQILLDEMRSLAPPLLPPPRPPLPTPPTGTPAARSHMGSTQAAVSAASRRRRRPAALAAALVAMVVASLLVWRDPLGLRGSEREAAPFGGEVRAVGLVPAASHQPQGGTAGVVRSFDAGCVMPPDRSPCDGVTLALWRGDLGAWRALAAQNRLPPPDAEAAFRSAIALRLEAGDPATQIDVARRSGQAAPFLGAAWVHGAGPSHDVEVELRNLGAAIADLSGAELVTERGELLVRLPANASVPAGIRCRLSTRPTVSNPCDFARETDRRPAGSRPGTLILRAGSGEMIDRFELAEAARPTP